MSRKEGSSVSRRKLLSILGIGTITSVAGCSAVDSMLSEPSNSRSNGSGANGQGTATDNSTSVQAPEQQRTGQQSKQGRVGEMQQTHSNFLSDMPNTQRQPRFNYKSIDVQIGDSKQENKNMVVTGVTAAPAKNSGGDRLMITEGSRQAATLRDLLLATWAAPVGKKFVETTAFGEQISFVGGEGPIIVVAAAVGSHPDKGEAVYLARGQEVKQVENIAKKFENIEESFDVA